MGNIAYNRHLGACKFAQLFPYRKSVQQTLVGCSFTPSPALTMAAGICCDKKCGAPLALCRITTISTFMDKILFTVSRSVSPFDTEDPDAVKLIVSADNLFSASSKEIRVRVEFS